MHPFTGVQVTAKGVDHLASYVDVVGYDIAIAADHFGHIALDSCIRIGRALEPLTLAWIEDLIPWQLTDQWRRLTAAVAVPTCTGEVIYPVAGFRPLLDAGAIRVVHPDAATSGGIAETKRLGDYAQERGVAMALHLVASPIATMACVHLAAATKNFLALEHHAADVEFWSDLGTGLPRPLIQNGDIDEELLRCHLDPRDPVFFAEATHWDGESSHDRLWS